MAFQDLIPHKELAKMSENDAQPTRHFFSRVLILLFCAASLLGCDRQLLPFTKVQHGLASPTFSPDNGSILFTLCDIPGRCDIATYNLASKQLFRSNPTGQDCLAPMYSPDGKMLTFISSKDDDRNVFVMNADGSGLQQLTHTVNTPGLRNHGDPVVRINGEPSFSPDRSKVIFVRSGVRRQRSMGGKMLSHWDIYEIEVATGRERRITNYSYYEIERPYYLPEGKGVLFSGSGPKGDNLTEEMLPRNGNGIMVMEEGQATPHRAFEHQTYAVRPSIASNGAIVFVSRSNEFDGMEGRYYYDLFLRKDGVSRRLTSQRFTTITSPFLSFDGSRVVFLANRTDQEGPALWLVNSDGTGLTNVGRPWNEINN